MLALKNLLKKYDTNLILQVPELTIPNGTFWIEGGNGSGKTTLLKIIAGICPFEGSVCLNNIDLKESPVLYRKEISYAEAEPLFPPALTGEELIQFVQKTRNAEPSQTASLIDQFGIHHFIDRPVKGYSSGMMKKLSLLLAFIGSPELILLDEPLITLDTDFIPVLLSTLQEKQRAGMSFLITSHQAFETNPVTFNGKISVCNQSVKLDLF